MVKELYIFATDKAKNSFRCHIKVEPEILDCKIHKLLLQPFIENAIIHGFEGIKREHVLKIELRSKDEFIYISIIDNGKGMEPSLVEKFNKKGFDKTESDSHIGMENAISRLYMYYGNKASVRINSSLGEGTEIIVLIPWR